MTSVVGIFNLFPQTRFWNVKKAQKIDNTVGGLATIIVALLMVAVFVFELKTVFERTKKTILQTNRPRTSSPVITTQTNRQNLKPITLFITPTVSTHLNKDVSIKQENGVDKLVQLQTCTAAHFPTQSLFQQYNYNSWCLPLHTTHVMKDKVSLSMTHDCDSSTGTDCKNDYVELSAINSQLDVTGSGASWNYYVSSKRVFMENRNTEMTFQVQETVLEQTKGLFPFQDQVTKVSSFQFDMERAVHYDFYTISGSTYFTFSFDFKSAPTYRAVKVKYYTVLNAFSYAGGLFNSIFALFFLLKWYAATLPDFQIADDYFHRKQAQSYNIISYITLKIYRGIVKFCCCGKPDWPVTQRRDRLSKTVKALMDVTYLHKRLQFLQRGLSLVLEKHQLKGLHLLRSQRRKECDEAYKEYGLRKRLKYFFKKNKRENVQNGQQQGSRTKIINQESFIEPIDLIGSQKNKKEIANSEISWQSVEGNTFNLDRQTKNRKKKIKGIDSSKIIPLDSIQQIGSSKGQDLKDKSQDEGSGDQSDYQGQALEDNQNEDLIKYEIEDELKNDLKVLINEAESGRNPTSAAIVDRLEIDLRQWIRHKVGQNEHELQKSPKKKQ